MQAEQELHLSILMSSVLSGIGTAKIVLKEARGRPRSGHNQCHVTIHDSLTRCASTATVGAHSTFCCSPCASDPSYCITSYLHTSARTLRRHGIRVQQSVRASVRRSGRSHLLHQLGVQDSTISSLVQRSPARCRGARSPGACRASSQVMKLMT